MRKRRFIPREAQLFLGGKLEQKADIYVAFSYPLTFYHDAVPPCV